ncbi:prephenate dehydrogenase [Fusobacterium sp. MFO224]|uniref:prephenate dehydrogenase n=1 Tax=Fusobacterium sp. MFO224 TaxID=3378070 RepID=UPI003854198C
MIGNKNILEKKIEDLVFAIVGVGLIGGSYAKYLRKLKVKKIIGVDINKDYLDRALKENIIDEAYEDPKENIKKADVIIFSIYPSTLVNFIKNNVKYFKGNVLLTDATGIKNKLIKEIEPFLGENMDFIFGHPMAGREGIGVGQSTSNMFEGASYILIPIPRNKKNNIIWMENFINLLGFKDHIKVSPEKHDEIISYTSQLPHVMAVALVNSSNMDEKSKYFIGGGYRDTTRVADINEDLWSELLLDNKKFIVKEIKKLENELGKWIDALETDDVCKLKNMMKEATVKRRGIIDAKNKN